MPISFLNKQWKLNESGQTTEKALIRWQTSFHFFFLHDRSSKPQALTENREAANILLYHMQTNLL